VDWCEGYGRVVGKLLVPNRRHRKYEHAYITIPNTLMVVINVRLWDSDGYSDTTDVLSFVGQRWVVPTSSCSDGAVMVQ